MRAKLVNEGIKHLSGRSEEEIKSAIALMSFGELFRAWNSTFNGWQEEKPWLEALLKYRGSDILGNELNTILRYYQRRDNDEAIEMITRNRSNESIEHLSPRSEEEIFSTYPKSWQEFIVKIKEMFPTVKYDPGLFDEGYIRVIIRKKSYLIAFQKDVFIRHEKGFGEVLHKIVVYHLIKTKKENKYGSETFQLSWDVLKAVDDYQQFKEYMKL